MMPSSVVILVLTVNVVLMTVMQIIMSHSHIIVTSDFVGDVYRVCLACFYLFAFCSESDRKCEEMGHVAV